MVNRISVVTPTLRRPREIADMLENLSHQTVLPFEVVIVDGAPAGEDASQRVIEERVKNLAYPVRYIRRGGGTAIQRNIGIDHAAGDYLAFIDDDVRLDPDYFERMLEVYTTDLERKVGGIAGYIVNQYLDKVKSPRWRWYTRLHLFSTYEPGRYDYKTGYPINRYLQPPHSGVREIDFMGSNCGVWRREVFEQGLRFDEFFRDYGVLEDAHLALRARRHWQLLECGRARCTHLDAKSGRTTNKRVAWKTAVNYRYVFMDIVPQRSWRNNYRFWQVQLFDLFRIAVHAARYRRTDDWGVLTGKASGIWAAWWLKPPLRKHEQL
jgi:GT2 family glycosyltransferase